MTYLRQRSEQRRASPEAVDADQPSTVLGRDSLRLLQLKQRTETDLAVAVPLESLGGLGLIPAGRHAPVIEASIQWNYTFVLNIIFLILAAAPCCQFAAAAASRCRRFGRRARRPG